jgi:DNA-binding transcriptional LysR family regulator
VARAVGDMRRMVVASPDYLATHGEPHHPSEIAAHRTVHFGALSAAPDWRFVEDGREVRVACAPRFTTNSADAAIFHAEQGGGLTRVLAYQAADGLASGRLKAVLTDYEIAPLPIHLVYPTSRLLSAKVRAFVDLVLHDCDWHFAKR